MIQLTPADTAKAQQLTAEAYSYLHPAVQEYMTEQLAEVIKSDSYYEYIDWLERMEATRDYYQNYKQVRQSRRSTYKSREIDVPASHQQQC